MDRSVQPTARAEAAAPNIHSGAGNQLMPLMEGPAPFEPFLPADHQVQEFASICGVPNLNAARQHLDDYALHRYQGRYPPAMIDHALRHALLAARQSVIRSNPFGWIDTAISNRIGQYSRHEIQLELDVRTMALRAEAEARGEVFLPPPSTLEREIAKWLADPGKWSGIKPGLDYDHIAEVAEEFVGLPPHATPIMPRHVRKAFEDTRETKPINIQAIARATLYRIAYGSPENQLQGRPLIEGWFVYATDYAALPEELLAEAMSTFADVFDDRRLGSSRDARRGHLIFHLRDFIKTVGTPDNDDYPAHLYGTGELQERVEVRARELAIVWCEKKRAEDAQAIAKLECQQEEDVARLNYLRLHPDKRIPLDCDLERRITEWPERHARLKEGGPC